MINVPKFPPVTALALTSNRRAGIPRLWPPALPYLLHPCSRVDSHAACMWASAAPYCDGHPWPVITKVSQRSKRSPSMARGGHDSKLMITPNPLKGA